MNRTVQFRTIRCVLKGLLTILLLWIGFSVFALLLHVLGLRGDSISSTFSEVRAQLQSNADTPDLELSQPHGGNFDNALVYLYLVPLFAFRWASAFAADKGISPVPVLIAILAIAGVLAMAYMFLGMLAGIALPLLIPPYTIRPDLIYVPHPGHLLDAAIFLFAVVPALILCCLASLVGPPLLLIRWFQIVPSKLDRYLRSILDLRSGQYVLRYGHRTSYISNTLLLACMTIPVAIGLWWICDLLDGTGGSDFAFVARGGVIAICVFTLGKAHLRAFGYKSPIPAS